MEFDKAVAELDTLIGTLERDEDERALMLLQLIDAVHRPALELIVAGELDHPVAHAVLSMYDLVDVDDRVEVEEALDEVRPYIESHGGGLELLLAHPTGVVEIYYGKAEGAKLELATDAVARTATAKEYVGGHRLYGLVEGELLWTFDMAAVGQEIQSHIWARLQRAP